MLLAVVVKQCAKVLAPLALQIHKHHVVVIFVYIHRSTRQQVHILNVLNVIKWIIESFCMLSANRTESVMYVTAKL